MIIDNCTEHEEVAVIFPDKKIKLAVKKRQNEKHIFN